MQKIKGANKKKSRYYNDNAPLFSKLDLQRIYAKYKAVAAAAGNCAI